MNCSALKREFATAALETIDVSRLSTPSPTEWADGEHMGWLQKKAEDALIVTAWNERENVPDDLRCSADRKDFASCSTLEGGRLLSDSEEACGGRVQEFPRFSISQKVSRTGSERSLNTVEAEGIDSMVYEHDYKVTIRVLQAFKQRTHVARILSQFWSARERQLLCHSFQIWSASARSAPMRMLLLDEEKQMVRQAPEEVQRFRCKAHQQHLDWCVQSTYGLWLQNSSICRREKERQMNPDTRIAGLVLPSARELLRRTRGDVAIAKQLQESLQLEVIRTMLGNNVSVLDGTDSCLSGNE